MAEKVINTTSLTIAPIGVIHTNSRVKFEAPHQPDKVERERNVLELFKGNRFENALSDLAGFERIWVIWWFHRNTTWRPMVLPPRGTPKRRGLFATRSPHRPNPIGITAVSLIGIEGSNLIIGNCDLLDGTPILDIKPYISEVDSFPQSRNGWLSEIEAEFSSPPKYSVTLSDLAQTQLSWLRDNWKIDFSERMFSILQRSPEPHRTRRIRRYGENQYRISCGAWRVIYQIQDLNVAIECVTRGFHQGLLEKVEYTRIPDREAQIAFAHLWPQT